MTFCRGVATFGGFLILSSHQSRHWPADCSFRDRRIGNLIGFSLFFCFYFTGRQLGDVSWFPNQIFNFFVFKSEKGGHNLRKFICIFDGSGTEIVSIDFRFGQHCHVSAIDSWRARRNFGDGGMVRRGMRITRPLRWRGTVENKWNWMNEIRLHWSSFTSGLKFRMANFVPAEFHRRPFHGISLFVSNSKMGCHFCRFNLKLTLE